MIRRRRLKTEVIQLRITPALKEKLRLEADAKEISVASVVEDALDLYFGKEPTVTDGLKSLEERVKKLEEASQRKKK